MRLRLNKIFICFQTNFAFHPTLVTPQLLGALPSNVLGYNFCNVVSKEAGLSDYNRDVVIIRDPTMCYPITSQVYCSDIEIAFNDLCKIPSGSPVICGNDSVISGFVLNRGSCSIKGLDYHSVGDFQDWINEVLNSGTAMKTSVLLVFSAIFLSFKNCL